MGAGKELVQGSEDVVLEKAADGMLGKQLAGTAAIPELPSDVVPGLGKLGCELLDLPTVLQHGGGGGASDLLLEDLLSHCSDLVEHASFQEHLPVHRRLEGGLNACLVRQSDRVLPDPLRPQELHHPCHLDAVAGGDRFVHFQHVLEPPPEVLLGPEALKQLPVVKVPVVSHVDLEVLIRCLPSLCTHSPHAHGLGAAEPVRVALVETRSAGGGKARVTKIHSACWLLVLAAPHDPVPAQEEAAAEGVEERAEEAADGVDYKPNAESEQQAAC
mmetsp:Transcript_3350/g.8087  ORF Transcript_3350/g.8087 Transcript_3350/m.8087 type:complete len:273 (+) Transcript_3350:867-1685(+)